MNTSKHTAGPWITSGIAGDNYVQARLPEGGKVNVAIVTGWDGNDQEQHDANLRLIASAPSLLAENEKLREALVEMLREFEPADMAMDYWPDAVHQARAALALAEGGAK